MPIDIVYMLTDYSLSLVLRSRSEAKFEMVMSEYAKRRVLSLHQSGYKVSHIAETLVLEDGIRISNKGFESFCYVILNEEL